MHILKKAFWCLLLMGLCSVLGATSVPLVTGEWEPFTGSKLPKMGFMTTLVGAAMTAGGLSTSVSFYPWTRDQFLIESGQVFGAFPYAITNERLGYAYFSDVICFGETLFFYKPAKHPNLHFETMHDLKAYRIAGAKGFFYEELFKNAGIQLTYIDHEEDLFKLLDLDRVDMIPIDKWVGWSYIKKNYPNKLNEFAVLLKPLNKSSLHLMVSKKYPDAEKMLKQFNQGLQKIKDDGTYNKILKEFGDPLQ